MADVLWMAVCFRLLIVSLLPVMLVGCGEVTGSGSDTSGSIGSPSKCHTVQVHLPGGGTRPELAPPAPRVSVRFASHRFHVDIRMLVNPKACRAFNAVVNVYSTAEPTLQGLPEATSSHFMELVDDHVSVVEREPYAPLPPYKVVAKVFTRNGLPSETVSKDVPYPGDYCMLHDSKAHCVRAAYAHFHHCSLGDVPRSQCLPWSYNPPRHAAPVLGTNLSTLTTRFREVAREGLLVESKLNETRLASLTCMARKNLYTCTATYKRHPDEGLLRIRYTVSGRANRPGCWYILRSDGIQPTETQPFSPLLGRIPTENELAGCIDKDQNP